ncbi:hypothetical protein [Streptomyces sp. HUCO-GS316]|uniref:hypothetical protein n=1 Tax=Streptomyces sp. HUCO-GS316 TaxID=2692198 RepID=UPI00136ECFAF|nr:hypothetical protein [Streptomyces sp. HUCO-GS316]
MSRAEGPLGGHPGGPRSMAPATSAKVAKTWLEAGYGGKGVMVAQRVAPKLGRSRPIRVPTAAAGELAVTELPLA